MCGAGYTHTLSARREVGSVSVVCAEQNMLAHLAQESSARGRVRSVSSEKEIVCARGRSHTQRKRAQTQHKRAVREVRVRARNCSCKRSLVHSARESARGRVISYVQSRICLHTQRERAAQEVGVRARNCSCKGSLAHSVQESTSGLVIC